MLLGSVETRAHCIHVTETPAAGPGTPARPAAGLPSRRLGRAQRRCGQRQQVDDPGSPVAPGTAVPLLKVPGSHRCVSWVLGFSSRPQMARAVLNGVDQLFSGLCS